MLEGRATLKTVIASEFCKCGAERNFKLQAYWWGEQVAKKYTKNIWSRSRAPEPIDGANYLRLYFLQPVESWPHPRWVWAWICFCCPLARTNHTWPSWPSHGPAMVLPGHQEPLRFLAPCALVASPGRCFPGENLGARRGWHALIWIAGIAGIAGSVLHIYDNGKFHAESMKNLWRIYGILFIDMAKSWQILHIQTLDDFKSPDSAGIICWYLLPVQMYHHLPMSSKKRISKSPGTQDHTPTAVMASPQPLGWKIDIYLYIYTYYTCIYICKCCKIYRFLEYGWIDKLDLMRETSLECFMCTLTLCVYICIML